MHPEILGNARMETPGEKVETIKFSKSATRMFREMRNRQSMELNTALKEVYEELGVVDRVDKQRETGEQVRVDKNFTFIEFITLPEPKKIEEGKDGSKSRKEPK